MRKKQAGVSLSGLLVAAVIIATVSMLGMKVIPAVIEYFQIVGAVKAVANDPTAKNSVADARKAFERRATVDDIASITAQDLEITKEGGELVVAFAYEKRVPIVNNVSLLIYFEGSSRK
ncbi:MAG: DUF4845 domain-containing protein [Rhodocyclaceae bacterium]|nr:DUF4845 domain-containing protein [Rhodocyclaceae bacterium]